MGATPQYRMFSFVKYKNDLANALISFVSFWMIKCKGRVNNANLLTSEKNPVSVP